MNVYLLLALCGAFVATVSASDLQDQIDKFAEDLFRVKEEIAKLKERIDAARLAEHEIPGRFGIKQFLKYVTAFLYFFSQFSLKVMLKNELYVSLHISLAKAMHLLGKKL